MPQFIMKSWRPSKRVAPASKGELRDVLKLIGGLAHKAANGGTRTAGKPCRVSDLKRELRNIRDHARAALT